MSSSSGRRKTQGLLFLVVILVMIPFAIVYYVSTDFYKARLQQWRERNEQASRPVLSKQNDDLFTLARDDKLRIDKICLEYKGVKEKAFFINLYLLDFDPDQPFLKRFSKKEAQEAVVIGGHRFEVLSGNDRFIRLKLIDSFQTP